MNEQQALDKMVAPGTRRPGKYREGVIQIHITRSCNLSCFNCTQGANYGGKSTFITLKQFEQAVLSLFPKSGTGTQYFGVCGVFGGNPALHPQFNDLCDILKEHVPFNQRGIWCNHPVTIEKAQKMRETFDPSVSNINVHLDKNAYTLFKEGWPECHPVGLTQDSRHAPVYVALKDVLKKDCGCSMDDTCLRCHNTRLIYDEERAWELISNCDINKHWSAMIGVFRGELRAWFCEIAGAQAMLHQDDPDYPDTGAGLREADGTPWWMLNMYYPPFASQVRKHCHECGIPLRGYGELSQGPIGTAKEQISETHASVCKPKRTSRHLEIVTDLQQLGVGKLSRMTDYLGNSDR